MSDVTKVPMPTWQTPEAVFHRLRALIPGGPSRLRPAGNREWIPEGSALSYTAFWAKASVDGATVKAGDFILRVRVTGGRLSREERAAVGGRLMRVPRRQFEAVATGLQNLHFVEGHFGALTGEEHLKRLGAYLSRPAVQKAQDSTSPIFILRPMRSGVSEPIHALSDEGALFELILSTGGRMPKEA